MKRIADVLPPPTDNEGARAYFGLFKAQVSENNDDAKRGRLKLVIPQVTGDVEHPTWADPVGLAMTPGQGYGGLDLPQKGDWVWVEFERGNPNEPRWRPGWWGDGELPDELKKNYPDVRGFKTKGGHVFFVDDKDGRLHFEHSDGHVVELSKDGVSVRGKDKNVSIDAGSGQVSIKSSAKVVLDAPSIEIASGASHPMLFTDLFLADFAAAWNALIATLAAGTVGLPIVQMLVALPGTISVLQQFGSKLAAGAAYESTKAKVG
jgi:hypothetical protein